MTGYGVVPMYQVEGESADSIWLQIAHDFYSGRVTSPQGGRGGQTYEVLNAALTVSDPRQRWITSRRPAINPAFAVAEVVWILRGRQDAKYLTHWNAQYPRFVGSGAQPHGAYGYRLRHHFGLDQLERAYQALLQNPDNRQTVLQIWDPQVDFPNTMGNPVAEDIPCNLGAVLKVRANKLEWLQILRSNDVIMGLPYNIVQWTSLQEVLAGWLGVEPGPYVHIAHSLHVYERDFADLNQLAEAHASRSTDSIALPKRESDHWFGVLDRRIELLSDSGITEDKVLELAKLREAPDAIANLLLVVGAEAARKHQWVELADEIMASCTNPALNQVWFNWRERTFRG